MKTDATAGINGTSNMTLAYQALRSGKAPQHPSNDLKIDNNSISDTLETTEREGDGKSERQSASDSDPPRLPLEPGSHLDLTG